MKIGIIVSAFTNGGAQRVAITLTKWLNNNGHEAFIIALNESNKNQYDTDSINLIHLHDLYKGQTITQSLRSFDRDNHIDVYIVMGVPMCIYVVPALKKTKAKLIVSERNDPRSFQGKTITKVISRWLMNRADGFVFQTNDASDYYVKYKSRSVVIPNPVAEVPIINKRIPNALRRKEIVTAGRLVPQKNHEMLIRAFANVADELPEYKLVIYGEGPLNDQLKVLGENLGIGDRIILPGSVNDLHERIVDAEVFVLSSDFEGMPNALMEAMAMGMTCISTDCPCGGPRELICNADNGLLVQVGNQKEMGKAIASCIRHKDWADKMGEKAALIKKNFSVDIVCEKWLNAIYEIIK